MASLPMDIIFLSILPRLPVKSLTRFKCVSRSFLAEISSPAFMKLHHLNAMSSDANRLLVVPNHMGFDVYDLDSPHAPPMHFPDPKPVTFCDLIISIVATCECYVLLGCGYTYLDGLILLNPSTRTYRELPSHHIKDMSSGDPWYGMCHILDEVNDDYKVVRFRASGEYMEVMVYSLRTNLWNLVESRITTELINSWCSTITVVQNHLLNILFYNQNDIIDGHMSRIGCFDIKEERWTHDVQLPDTLSDVNDSLVILGVLDGQLFLLVENMYESTYDLWVMKKYGVKESWAKLMSLPTCNDPEIPLKEVFHPLAYRKGSSHELLYKLDPRCKLIWYNLRERKGIEAEFLGLPNCRSSRAYVIKGTLVNFPGGQPILTQEEEEEEEEEEGIGEQYEDEEQDEDDFIDL